jgi:dihydrofolate reductase
LSRDIDQAGPMSYPSFGERIGACIMGATTWQWIVDHDDDPWGDLPTYVLTHRRFDPMSAVTFTDETVEQVHAEAVDKAGDKDVWLVGGGDPVGQFHDRGLLDEVWVQFAPVTLGAGMPVLPRHVELRLEEVARNRDFACVRHSVVKPATLEG